MTSDEFPQPDPHGALVPPDQYPPTAVGADTPEPPRPPRHARHVNTERHVSFGPDVKQLVNNVLDAIDRVAEKIAVELGVRPASGHSPPPPPAP